MEGKTERNTLLGCLMYTPDRGRACNWGVCLWPEADIPWAKLVRATYPPLRKNKHISSHFEPQLHYNMENLKFLDYSDLCTTFMHNFSFACCALFVATLSYAPSHSLSKYSFFGKEQGSISRDQGSCLVYPWGQPSASSDKVIRSSTQQRLIDTLYYVVGRIESWKLWGAF